jgi:uncharacterized low-complexity protein
MRKVLAGAASAGALLLATATPATAAPNPRACANGAHGTEVAHATVPHETRGNMQAHASIPHYCH